MHFTQSTRCARYFCMFALTFLELRRLCKCFVLKILLAVLSEVL